MTDLVLTDDSKQYQDLARDFSQNEIAPRAESFDHSGQLPQELWKKVWEVGLANMQVPEEFGGLGLSSVDAAAVAEELGAGCAGITAAFWGTDLAVAPLLVAGTDEQKKKRVEPLMSEFALAGFSICHTGNLRDSGGKLNGEIYCVNATQAKWLNIAFDTANGAPLIYSIERNAPGVKVGEQMTRIGLKAADIALVKFKDVELKKEDLVCDVSQVYEPLLARIAVTVAAYATGIARSAMEHAIRYSKERTTFGVAIGNHQAVGFMLADMAKNIEAARYMTRKAAWLIDHNEASTVASLSARAFALETAMQAATDAVQVFGGYGYSREYPVEKLMRDVKTMTALLTNPLQTKVECGKELIAAAGSR